MKQGTDRRYLLTHQYRNAANLNARMQLHERFSMNNYGWHRWIFERLGLPPDARILELRCGPGTLWRENSERIPEGWQIILSDFSPGMVQEARQSLSGAHPGLNFEVLDAQAIPFASASFDAVIANHMLYHVPDRAKAFAEIRRVLKPEGRFYAATNGAAHMRELHERVQHVAARTLPTAAAEHSSLADSWTEAFNLENGQEELSPWFSGVTLHRYPDALVVTEAEPLVAYVLSGRYASTITGDSLAEFVRSVEEEIAQRGAFRITKDAGLFEAWQKRE